MQFRCVIILRKFINETILARGRRFVKACERDIPMKKIILAIILQVLYRALRVLNRRDDSVAAELGQLPEGACVRIRAGMTADAPQLTMVRRDGGLKKGAADQPAGIEIAFKSLSSAFRVFTGCQSIGQAYCEHRFVLAGNINETMCLVRAIETAEGYLFPRLWNRRILKRRVRKQLPPAAVYALALCGRD